ncbi:sterol desaturase family protein [Rheinheimera baltica]|uniref:sterol desaturase family protein n=1 Tax=Rheinheimera baltica TaxID=67576 RepID=UPI00273FD018|nr:sterol desaturase family protein [Rheinheimera baltica]MDP5142674.1 sterol desaturase family protein [Rheinheimera baltica]
MSLIIYAIPVFFALIFLELWFDHKRRNVTYSFNDAINSLNLGVMSQVTGIAYKTVQFSFYLLVFQYLAPLSLGVDSPWMWLFAFVAYDFCYYWYHRMSHEINVLWASHLVHHQSEEYNLTTALRQTSGSFFAFVFYLPLALIGIEPYVLLTVASLNLIYQFWVHTRHIDRMPRWYEALFVTPSNHRVHHAQNPIYINKNHGGVFIIWDRLFGTFQAELREEPVIFGVTKPLASWNPLWANIEMYWSLTRDAWCTRRWQDKLGIWFRPTGWRPVDARQRFPSKAKDPYQQVKFDTPLTGRQKAYAFFQHLTLVAIALYFLLTSASLSTVGIFTGSGIIIFCLFCLGCYQEQSRHYVWLEAVKNVLLAVTAVWVLPFASQVYALLWLLLASTLLLRGMQQRQAQCAGTTQHE